MPCYRKKMIILYPNHIVRLRDLLQLFGKHTIDSLINAKIFTTRYNQIRAVMHPRPKSIIGVTTIIFFILYGGKSRRDIGDFVVLLSRKLVDGIGLIADICHYLTVPTDPNTAIFGKGFLKRYRQPSCHSFR